MSHTEMFRLHQILQYLRSLQRSSNDIVVYTLYENKCLQGISQCGDISTSYKLQLFLLLNYPTRQLGKCIQLMRLTRRTGINGSVSFTKVYSMLTSWKQTLKLCHTDTWGLTNLKCTSVSPRYVLEATVKWELCSMHGGLFWISMHVLIFSVTMVVYSPSFFFCPPFTYTLIRIFYLFNLEMPYILYIIVLLKMGGGGTFLFSIM